MLISVQKMIEKFKQKKDVCRGTLTDREYLGTHDPHHQVAVDISIMLQKIKKSIIQTTYFKINYLDTKL